MPSLIRDGAIVEDNWIRVDNREASIDELPEGSLLLPLNLWNQFASDLVNTGRQVGLWLACDELPDNIQGDIEQIPVIAVEFPAFTDGRGFSIGRLLRERFGFGNELRAFGAPIRDQLTYLKRCGFNAFQLADHYDPAAAVDSLNDFTEHYQTAFDRKEPKFRRYS